MWEELIGYLAAACPNGQAAGFCVQISLWKCNFLRDACSLRNMGEDSNLTDILTQSKTLYYIYY